MKISYKKLSERVAYKGYKHIVVKWYRNPEGRKQRFDCIETEPAVCVLALTPEKMVILVKQFRAGPERILTELPGGGIEKGERPMVAARRELLEETGYKGRVRFVTRSLDDAYSTMNRYCYVASDCVKVASPQQFENEFVKVVLVTIPEFRELLRSGRLTDVEVGYLGLDFLGLL